MKLNNKGMSIIEIVVTFTIIMFLMTGLLMIVVNYRDKAAVSLERLELETFRNNITQDINNDILEKGLKEINYGGACSSITGLNRCINLVFDDGSEKAFGTSKVVYTDANSVTNKFIYYDGIKYKLKDKLPIDIPENRTPYDVSQIKVMDDAILNSTFVPLEDGTEVYIYTIDIEISHIDFSDDFGIHIVASTDNLSM